MNLQKLVSPESFDIILCITPPSPHIYLDVSLSSPVGVVMFRSNPSNGSSHCQIPALTTRSPLQTHTHHTVKDCRVFVPIVCPLLNTTTTTPSYPQLSVLIQITIIISPTNTLRSLSLQPLPQQLHNRLLRPPLQPLHLTLNIPL